MNHIVHCLPRCSSVRSRLKSTVLVAACLLVGAVPDQASAGWFDSVKEALGGSEGSEALDSAGALSSDEIGRGLKEALQVGTENVVAQLGTTGGFDLDPEIHIPLPSQLEGARKLLAGVGMDSTLTDLEQRLNRAAEIATPKAKALFLDAIQDMTLDDVMGIYNGPDDAATQYFRGRMSDTLVGEMTPVVDESLGEAGAVQVYDTVMDQYHQLPFVPEIDADLTGYVVEKGVDGIFYYLAREEAAIRENPAKRTTQLLKQVFGSGG